LNESLSFREDVRPSDPAAVRAIVTSSGFFHPAEIEIAVELVHERLNRDLASGYHFIFVEVGGEVAGYVCFGPIACTVASWDCFWIAVHERFRDKKLGSQLLARSERRIGELGGKRIYVETSSRAQYEPTRAFYERRAYVKEAVLEDFYAPGDGKVIYVKALD
jgi:ribosomal protein S18 acetylase RimI-like enzyme